MAAFPAIASCDAGLLSGLARAFAAGGELDLLAPYGWAAPGAPPSASPGPAPDRAALAAALGTANAAYGHPRAAELARRLADPATAVVVTGQQTGLFGGALLTLVKAAAAVRWAAALEAAGQPAVALFWMATEDHDWQEVASTVVLAADGPRRLTLGDDPQPLAPVGLRVVGAAVAERLAELAALFPAEWFRAWIEELAAWWRPEARFAEAFARQHVATLGGQAPLYLDALLPALKAAEQPHLVALVERRVEYARALARREAALGARGQALPVAPQPEASPLFLLRGAERRRIEWRGSDRFALRGVGGEQPVAELLAVLADNPAVVSPGVLARPAVQDAVLGSALFLVGPGEAGYLPQAAAAHEVLGIAAPRVALRPHALALDRRAAEHLAALGGTLEELLTAPERLRERLAARAGGGFVAPARAEIVERVEALAAPAQALDDHLAKPHEKTRETIERALDAFAAKVAAAAARRDEVAARRLEQLEQLVRPLGRPQERTLAAAWFPGRFGHGFGAALAAALDLDARRLSVVDPE